MGVGKDEDESEDGSVGELRKKRRFRGEKRGILIQCAK
jgi:hypothetical protein